MLPDDAPVKELLMVTCPAAPLVPLTIDNRDPEQRYFINEALDELDKKK